MVLLCWLANERNTSILVYYEYNTSILVDTRKKNPTRKKLVKKYPRICTKLIDIIKSLVLLKFLIQILSTSEYATTEFVDFLKSPKKAKNLLSQTKYRI